jgi:hypothetical protein
MALPLLGGAAKLTVSGPVDVVVVPATACTFVGAPGAPTTTFGDGADTGPLPRELVA